MQISKASKVLSAGVIAASLAVVPFTLPAQAQDNTTGTTGTTGTNTEVETVDTEDSFDWGWLGLLGLAGLAGLAGKKRQETVHHVNTDPDVRVRSGSDYR
jgi:hypothetical protein